MSRPEGSKNTKTMQWEYIGDFLMDEEGAGRFKNILKSSNDDDFVDRYLKILEYFKPKLARKELTGELTIKTKEEIKKEVEEIFL